MRILIDTHILIWQLEDDKRLSAFHGDLIEDQNNSILISIASFWEIAIKASRGKLSLARPIEDIFIGIGQTTSSILPIEPEHTLQVSKLPFHHGDPFDRMIIAQAMTEAIPIISTDDSFANYSVELF